MNSDLKEINDSLGRTEKTPEKPKKKKKKEVDLDGE